MAVRDLEMGTYLPYLLQKFEFISRFWCGQYRCRNWGLFVERGPRRIDKKFFSFRGLRLDHLLVRSDTPLRFKMTIATPVRALGLCTRVIK